MNLSSRREPSFDGAHSPHQSGYDTAHHGVHGGASAHVGARATGLTRVVSTVQIVGSLLAVPVGLGSAYSVYRANFSPETTCLNLRGNIISMLDRNVDAATRRMLVRRDVQSFEERCGSFDPDAHKAFKVLLAVPQVTASTAGAPQLRAALPVAEAKTETKADTKAEAKAETKSAERKAEVKSVPKVEASAKADVKPEIKSEPKAKVEPRAVAKRPDAAPVQTAVAAPEPVQRDAGVSDTRWLAAVREALVTHDPDAANAIVAPAAAAKPELGKPELGKPEPVKPVPTRLEQAKPQQTKPEQAKSAPANSELAKSEPNTPAQAQGAADKSEQAGLEQANAQAQSGQAKPVQDEPSAAGKDAAAPISLQPAWNVRPVPADAPASPPVADANAAQPPQASGGNHPVPPAAIPVSEEKDGDHSQLGSWIAQIPFVGRVIEPRN